MEAAKVPAEAVLSEQRLWGSNGGICRAEAGFKSNGKDDVETISEYNKINFKLYGNRLQGSGKNESRNNEFNNNQKIAGMMNHASTD